PRFETNSTAGEHVEPLTPCFVAVEVEGSIHFGEVEVRADLDRSICGVGHPDGRDRQALVDDDVVVRHEALTGNDRGGLMSSRTGAPWRLPFPSAGPARLAGIAGP